MVQNSSIREILRVASQQGLEWRSTARHQVVARIQDNLLLVLTRKADRAFPPVGLTPAVAAVWESMQPLPSGTPAYVQLDVRELDAEGEPEGPAILTADARDLSPDVAAQLTSLWYAAKESEFAPPQAVDRILKALGG